MPPPPKKPDNTRPMPTVGKTAATTRLETTRPTKVYPGGGGEKTNPFIQPDAIVTDGMKARRREIEKKKRAAAVEKLHQDEESREGWARVRKAVFWAIALLAVGFAWWRIDIAHGNQWPIEYVWGLIAIAFLGGFGWIIWYMNRPEM